ncbi:MAG: cold-shock protein [Roseateles depolymerans]|uniref:Cold-shock protein n=1 Tax=Roseateles depolymerans TaxID=76731 RepID=A0A2W5D811_9BURK|nr:MAG: cold-shock protein [Roseateles depolymerans]
MRSQGILRSWQEERGFGFIAPTQGGAEVFVHISAFARDGGRPVQGESLSYELGRGADGRVQAVRVQRTALGTPAPGRPGVTRSAAARSAGLDLPRLLGSLLILALLSVLGAWGWRHYQAAATRLDLERQAPSPVLAEPGPTASPYRCDGRTRCEQMSSCAEATWFVKHCPGTQMDGNHDGVPCERQWCTGG